MKVVRKVKLASVAAEARHGNKGNVWFADGHVESLQRPGLYSLGIIWSCDRNSIVLRN